MPIRIDPAKTARTKPADPEVQQLIDESVALRAAVTDIIMAWSHLEAGLATVLRDVLRDEMGSIAFAIFFAPSNFETRLAVVDAAFSSFAAVQDQQGEILKIWQHTKAKISRHKKVRNQAAHGQIATFARYGKNHIRLVPNIFDFNSISQPILRRQLPGLGSQDVRQAITETANCTDALYDFASLTRALHQKDSAATSAILERLGKRLSAPQAKKKNKG